MQSVEFSVAFAWQRVGAIGLDPSGKLIFPKTSSSPGLYRFDISYPQGHATYIGETDQLARRLQHYRTPGPSQRTNIRLNEVLIAALGQGIAVNLSTVTTISQAQIAEQVYSVDLSSKADRVLVEHAAIIVARQAGLAIVNA